MNRGPGATYPVHRIQASSNTQPGHQHSVQILLFGPDQKLSNCINLAVGFWG